MTRQDFSPASTAGAPAHPSSPSDPGRLASTPLGLTAVSEPEDFAVDPLDLIELESAFATLHPIEAPHRPGRARRFRSVALFALALCTLLPLFSGRAAAQDLPSNRRAGSIVMYDQDGGDPGMVQLSVLWYFNVMPASVDRDLSTHVDLYVNGTRVGTQLVDATVHAGSTFCGSPPCNGSCGDATIAGHYAALLCYLDGPPPSDDCDCGQQILTPMPDPYDFEPGDEIMVILRPAAGSEPERDTSDDVFLTTFQGGPSFWNRGIRNVELFERTDGRFDLRVEGATEFDGQQGVRYLDLGLEVVVEVNGVPVASDYVSQDVEPATESCFYLGCGNYCGVIEGIERNCDDVLFHGCMCGGDWLTLFPGIDFEPGDEILVLLRPAPGALPELPGFEGDDERSPGETSSADAGGKETFARADLQSPRPNPLRAGAEALLTFQLDRPAAVRLDIVDATGRLVRNLTNQKFPQGSFSRYWDGTDERGNPVPNGVYFNAMTVDGGAPIVRKLVVVE